MAMESKCGQMALDTKVRKVNDLSIRPMERQSRPRTWQIHSR